MFRRGLALVSLALCAGCFNPDESDDTDGAMTGGSRGSSTGLGSTGIGDPSTTSTSGVSTATTDDETSTLGDSGNTSTGNDIPDWGEGEPPDFGDLGDDGEGSVLVVHALDETDDVDVWLVGEAAPITTDLQLGDAVRLEGIPRDARRIVLARAGTQDVVACSDWFPLRADEQWATVATGSAHDCTSRVDGTTPTFQQTRALTGNTIRFVHGGRPDTLSISRAGVSEGELEPGGTLSGSDLPECVNGCSVAYAVSVSDVGEPRHVTFQTVEVTDVPDPGELLFVVQGDVRQDWPREADAVRLLAITIDGNARELRRDPEVAFIAPDTNATVSFLELAAPALNEIAVSAPCFMETCELDTVRRAPGEMQFFVDDGGVNTDETFDLEAGQRYVLAHTPAGEILLLQDSFSRADETVAIGRVANWNDGPLSVGRVFAGMSQAFPNFLAVPAGTISDEDEVPVGSWDLVDGGKTVGGPGCFSPTNTPALWRGFFWGAAHINLDAWPPSQTTLVTLCS